MDCAQRCLSQQRRVRAAGNTWLDNWIWSSRNLEVYWIELFIYKCYIWWQVFYIHSKLTVVSKSAMCADRGQARADPRGLEWLGWMEWMQPELRRGRHHTGAFLQPPSADTRWKVLHRATATSQNLQCWRKLVSQTVSEGTFIGTTTVATRGRTSVK